MKSQTTVEARKEPPSNSQMPPCLVSLHRRFQLVRGRILGALFHWHAFAQWTIPLHDVPGLKWIPFVTVGELLLTIPIVALVWAGMFYTFVVPDTVESGFVAWYSIVTVFLMANKSTSALHFVFGLSWERVVPFHYATSVVAVLASAGHFYVCFNYDGDDFGDRRDLGRRGEKRWNRPMRNNTVDDADPPSIPSVGAFYPDQSSIYSANGPETNALLYMWDGAVNFSGTVMVITISLLIFTSAFRWFREKNFDLWLAGHIFLCFCIVGFSLVHSPSTTKIMFSWWFIDAMIRYLIMPKFMSPKEVKLLRLSNDLVEIRFPKPPHFRYRAGQFVKVAIPELGSSEYHPVTVSSAPCESDMTVHFRVKGDWTKRLHSLSCKQETVSVSLQGPFGSLTMDLDDYERYPRVLLVAGGIGVTPMMSLVRELMHGHNEHQRRRVRISLVWAVQNAEMTNALPVLRSSSLPTGKSDSLGSSISTYCSSTSTLDTLEEGVEYIGDLPNDEVFHGDIFVTRKSGPPSWTDNRFCVHHECRPDMDVIINEISNQVMADQRDGGDFARVAVVACGPKSLVEATKVACRKHSASPIVAASVGGAVFDFHEEIFDY